MEDIVFRPIGVIHSPFSEPKGTPIQAAARDEAGTVEIFEQFAEGLKDLDGFSHIILLFHFHRSKESSLLQKPFLDDHPRGVFSIRSPSRPNPIGMSVVKLERVEGNILHIRGVDMIDGTPLLDIKPYIPAIDSRTGGKAGWLEGKTRGFGEKRDDGRFST